MLSPTDCPTNSPTDLRSDTPTCRMIEPMMSPTKAPIVSSPTGSSTGSTLALYRPCHPPKGHAQLPSQRRHRPNHPCQACSHYPSHILRPTPLTVCPPHAPTSILSPMTDDTSSHHPFLTLLVLYNNFASIGFHRLNLFYTQLPIVTAKQKIFSFSCLSIAAIGVVDTRIGRCNIQEQKLLCFVTNQPILLLPILLQYYCLFFVSNSSLLSSLFCSLTFGQATAAAVGPSQNCCRPPLNIVGHVTTTAATTTTCHRILLWEHHMNISVHKQ